MVKVKTSKYKIFSHLSGRRHEKSTEHRMEFAVRIEIRHGRRENKLVFIILCSKLVPTNMTMPVIRSGSLELANR